MIRLCNDADVPAIEAIINEAARKYQGVIPADCWHEPYMNRKELTAEIAAGVRFYGFQNAGSLVGVMGIQKVRDAKLIRHAYVSSAHQGSGIGSALLDSLVRERSDRLLVGTWADAKWAIRFYERHGFRLVENTQEKNQLLDTYWTIPRRQQDTSVVLAFAGVGAA